MARPVPLTKVPSEEDPQGRPTRTVVIASATKSYRKAIEPDELMGKVAPCPRRGSQLAQKP